MELNKDYALVVTKSSVVHLSLNLPEVTINSEIALSLPPEKPSSPCIVGISSDLKRLCIYCDNKNVFGFEISEKLSQLFFHTLPKKPSKIIFVDSSVIVIDKAGDVYIISDSDLKLLLGHTSILFDFCLTKDKKYILTADRDEKIRISHFPNSYNIYGFCLGHREFVTSLIMLSEEYDVFASGSGDGTVKIWNIENCKCLFTIDCLQIVDKSSEKVIIKALLDIGGMLLVVSENPNLLILYSYEVTDKSAQAQLLCHSEIPSKVAKVLKTTDSVLVLTLHEEKPLLQYKYRNGKLEECDLFLQTDLVPKLRETAQMVYKDFSEFYHKRIDNEGEYKLRKDERVKQKRKESYNSKSESDAKVSRLSYKE